jgi:hypothetical protein
MIPDTFIQPRETRTGLPWPHSHLLIQETRL